MPSPQRRGSRTTVPAAPAVPPYRSPSLEILETLGIENALTTLESRLDSLEIDLARLTGSREDDVRRQAGDLAVMKARVEDAVAAMAATTEDVRRAIGGAEQRIGEGELARAQANAGLIEIAERLTAAMLRLERRTDEVEGALLVLGEHLAALVQLPERVAELERRMQDAGSGPSEPGGEEPRAGVD